MIHSSTMEVHSHGFIWEKELLRIYGATSEEIDHIPYTSKMDLPAELNRMDHCDVSIKTTCKKNMVCMADCLRIFDSSQHTTHMTVVLYQQRDSIKHVISITEVDLSQSRAILFGSLTREALYELDQLVKSIPQKRRPTVEERQRMYTLRDLLQAQSGAIHLDIKCNSQQSRLQCSFNHFQTFLEKYPMRIVAQSNTSEFRGGVISTHLVSARRVFKR